MKREEKKRSLWAASAGLAMLLAIGAALGSCEGCNEKQAPAKVANAPSAAPSAAPKAPAADSPLTNSNYYIEQEKEHGELALKAKKEFDAAYAKDPRAPETWAAYLAICQAQQLSRQPGAVKCFDRFFSETKGLKLDERITANAYRGRIVLALESKNGYEAGFLYDRLAPIESRLMQRGELEPKLQAYSNYLRCGALYYQRQIDPAIDACRRAIAILRTVKGGDPFDILEYLERLGDYQQEGQHWSDALKTYDELIAEMEKLFGKIHLSIGYIKLKRINVLLAMDDNAAARAEWDYIAKTVEKTHPNDLPPDISALYVQTLVRLNTLGLIK